MAAEPLNAESPGCGDQSCDPPVVQSTSMHETETRSGIPHSELNTEAKRTIDKDQNDSNSPGGRNCNTDQLHKQVQLLEAQLKAMQDSTEQDKIMRQEMMEKLNHNDYLSRLPRLPHPVLGNERIHEVLDHILPRSYFDHDPDHHLDRDYTDMAIRSYENELRYLTKQKRKSEKLHEEMNKLRQAEMKWEIERNALLKSLQKEENEVRRGSVSTEGGSSHVTQEETEERDAPSTLPLEIPALNYVEWEDFRAILFVEQPKEFFAIDMLKGEPILTFDHHYTIHRVEAKKRKAPVPAKQVLSPGQEPLPERIRINSTYITKFLEEIDGEDFSMDPGTVMIRPYKALAYYEERIRESFEALHAKVVHLGGAADNNNVDDASKNVEIEDNEGGSNSDPAYQTTSTALSEDNENGDTAFQEEDRDKIDANDCNALAATYRHLIPFMDFMKYELRTKMDYISSDDCHKVSFADLWYLFKPGDEVIGQNRRQAYRIIKITSTGHKVIRPAWFNFRGEESESGTPIILHCVYVDFDGKRLGPVSKEIKFQRFDGEKAVTSLEVFPIRYAEPKAKTGENAKQSLRDRLIDRGKKFLDMTTFKHMHYSGLTLDTRDEVDANVVVDFEEAFSANPDAKWMPELENLIGQSASEDTSEKDCNFACCQDEIIFKDGFVEKKRNQEYIAGLMPDSDDRNEEPSLAIYPRGLEDIKRSENEMDPRDLVIMSYRVFGFVLRSRKWAELDLTHLVPPIGSNKAKNSKVHLDNNLGHDNNRISNQSIIEGRTADKASNVEDAITNADGQASRTREKRDTAFDHLVLPDGHKKMILSLIAQHFRDKDASREEDDGENEQVDIVQGKGKGLIILLHGAPGVGKTSTAEGVAEKFEKPLFQITCGDLGTTAKDVDEALGTHFNLANKWGCVLLLDEADVFLAARSKEDFKRNGLVSVFLRVLEYYAGILFLTTNRVGDFDEAFTSRIHISLYYPQLQLDPTKEIFSLNLQLIKRRFEKKRRSIYIEEEGIIEFAESYWKANNMERWNGRQIRNACQTALALAEFDAQGGDHEQVMYAHATVQLRVHHLEIVSKAYLEFMDYLNQVRDLDADKWAKAIHIRAREGFMGKDKKRAKELSNLKMKNKIGHLEQHQGVTQPHSEPAFNLPPTTQLATNDTPIRSATATPQPPINQAYPYGAVPTGPPPGQMFPYYYQQPGFPPQGFQGSGHPVMHDSQQAVPQGYWAPQPHAPGSNASHGAPTG